MSREVGTKIGTAARQYWKETVRRLEARASHARGEISDETLAEILGPQPPPGASLADILKAIRKAPDGTFVGMLRKSGQELLTAAMIRRTSKRHDSTG